MSEKDHAIPVPIEWCISDNIISRYATNMVIQKAEHEYILSFFETRPPILLGSPEEIKAQAQSIKSVKAECISRIIISEERMPEFVKVLQDNIVKKQD
jgi:hypothetical protein